MQIFKSSIKSDNKEMSSEGYLIACTIFSARDSMAALSFVLGLIMFVLLSELSLNKV